MLRIILLFFTQLHSVEEAKRAEAINIIIIFYLLHFVCVLPVSERVRVACTTIKLFAAENWNFIALAACIETNVRSGTGNWWL